MKSSIYAAILLLLSGCVIPEDETESENVPSDVSGRYGFITSAISYSCSDGSSGTNSALGLEFDVTQEGTAIRMVQTANSAGGDGDVSGVTIIDADPITGSLTNSGNFVANSLVIAEIDGFSGQFTISYHLSGTFSTSGWSGDYSYTLYQQSTGDSCSYRTTFEGNK